ncbi:FAD synthetase [Methanomicrobium sp. W14]|uniref:adenylyltransferase/cytidyltransferase family protein n=1 Tax=Methanomicrobium sp. W14 TaxID=2817839 RepID=UPI001AE5C81F|nr:adenylyltransferase/cytidyltransferase family protein [Methanomicrobium sp. W14]MBP2133780.1 FAD synthetase [Methanomicrobium sp. W14]
MTRIVATGTFDILHPGHIYYLTESKKLGDELYVIIARDHNIKHKPKPVIPEEQRLFMVSSLGVVDNARLGDIEDMLKPIEDIKPDIITIGFNQYFDIEKLKAKLEERGIKAEVVKISGYKEDNGFSSSRSIMHQILKKRCHNKPSGEKNNITTG